MIENNVQNCIENIKSMVHVIECIANMQLNDCTDKEEVLELCMSMARLELNRIKNEFSNIYPKCSISINAWQSGPAPKDGSWIIGIFHGLPYVVAYDSWEIGGEALPDDTGSPPDGIESGWCLAGDNLHVMDQDEPEKWSRIAHPNQNIKPSWDGPGD